jgi:hypothetical protein
MGKIGANIFIKMLKKQSSKSSNHYNSWMNIKRPTSTKDLLKINYKN